MYVMALATAPPITLSDRIPAATAKTCAFIAARRKIWKMARRTARGPLMEASRISATAFGRRYWQAQRAEDGADNDRTENLQTSQGESARGQT